MGSYSNLLIGAADFLELESHQELIIYDSDDETLRDEFSKLAFSINALDKFTSNPIEQRNLIRLARRIEKTARRVKSKIRRQEVLNNDI
tara:strand:+ start:166 stop:432 length:267 start_codon:yes stop_codon:yes gene_type:complete